MCSWEPYVLESALLRRNFTKEKEGEGIKLLLGGQGLDY